MDKKVLQEFATRVTQANPSELVVVIYEAAIASMKEGKKALCDQKIEEARKELERARGMLDELMRRPGYAVFHFSLSETTLHFRLQGIMSECRITPARTS